MLPGLSDLRHGHRAGQQARSPLHHRGRPQREAAVAGVTALVFDFIERLLLQETPIATTEECEERSRFIGKFQQITSPVAAKGDRGHGAVHLQPPAVVERGRQRSDAVRRSNPAAVHAWLAERQAPLAARAVGNVDARHASAAKTSRARLNVLSEMPGGVEDGGDRCGAR